MVVRRDKDRNPYSSRIAVTSSYGFDKAIEVAGKVGDRQAAQANMVADTFDDISSKLEMYKVDNSLENLQFETEIRETKDEDGNIIKQKIYKPLPHPTFMYAESKEQYDTQRSKLLDAQLSNDVDEIASNLQIQAKENNYSVEEFYELLKPSVTELYKNLPKNFKQGFQPKAESIINNYTNTIRTHQLNVRLANREREVTAISTQLFNDFGSAMTANKLTQMTSIIGEMKDLESFDNTDYYLDVVKPEIKNMENQLAFTKKYGFALEMESPNTASIKTIERVSANHSAMEFLINGAATAKIINQKGEQQIISQEEFAKTFGVIDATDRKNLLTMINRRQTLINGHHNASGMVSMVGTHFEDLKKNGPSGVSSAAGRIISADLDDPVTANAVAQYLDWHPRKDMASNPYGIKRQITANIKAAAFQKDTMQKIIRSANDVQKIDQLATLVAELTQHLGPARDLSGKIIMKNQNLVGRLGLEEQELAFLRRVQNNKAFAPTSRKFLEQNNIGMTRNEYLQSVGITTKEFNTKVLDALNSNTNDFFSNDMRGTNVETFIKNRVTTRLISENQNVGLGAVSDIVKQELASLEENGEYGPSQYGISHLYQNLDNADIGDIDQSFMFLPPDAYAEPDPNNDYKPSLAYLKKDINQAIANSHQVSIGVGSLASNNVFDKLGKGTVFLVPVLNMQGGYLTPNKGLYYIGKEMNDNSKEIELFSSKDNPNRDIIIDITKIQSQLYTELPNGQRISLDGKDKNHKKVIESKLRRTNQYNKQQGIKQIDIDKEIEKLTEPQYIKKWNELSK